MKLNGHELEMKYVAMVTELERSKAHPHWSDKLWVGKFKRKLNKRLEQLESDYNKRLVTEQAYVIWKKMITKAIKD